MSSEKEKIMLLLKNEATFNEGFSLLVDAYTQPLYWHIRRLVVKHDDAEDILQEVFLKVLKNVVKIEGGAAVLSTWLFKIATNESLNWIKKRKATLFSSIDDVNIQLLDDFSHEITCSEDEIEAKFQKAILALPHKQKLVFNLRYYDELSYEQISEITGQSVATLKTNYHYATVKIKEILMQ